MKSPALAGLFFAVRIRCRRLGIGSSGMHHVWQDSTLDPACVPGCLFHWLIKSPFDHPACTIRN
jgi:hypothetical protein